MEESGGLFAAEFALFEEIVLKQHSVAIDKNQNVLLAILEWEVRGMFIVGMPLDLPLVS